MMMSDLEGLGIATEDGIICTFSTGENLEDIHNDNHNGGM